MPSVRPGMASQSSWMPAATPRASYPRRRPPAVDTSRRSGSISTARSRTQRVRRGMTCASARTLAVAGTTPFAPVLGFAYTPRFAEKLFGHDDTVIRGGFRVGFDEIFNNIPANMGLNAPYNLTTSQSAGTTQPGKFSWGTGLDQNVSLVRFVTGTTTPSVGLVSLSAEDNNIRSSYIYQYSLGVQRRF